MGEGCGYNSCRVKVPLSSLKTRGGFKWLRCPLKLKPITKPLEPLLLLELSLTIALSRWNYCCTVGWAPQGVSSSFGYRPRFWSTTLCENSSYCCQTMQPGIHSSKHVLTIWKLLSKQTHDFIMFKRYNKVINNDILRLTTFIFVQVL